MKKIKINPLFCFGIALFLTLNAGAQTNRIPSEMAKIFPKNEPGAALLIVKNGHKILPKGFGIADMSAGTKVTPQTHFRMASVSKQFTAMVILLLEKEGRLSITDPARKYLSSLPQFAAKVTIQQLMTHTSGIADYESLIPEQQQQQVTDADVLRLISRSDSLYFPPGTQFRYSNTGFCLLTQIAEKVSGKSYPDLIEELIFAPLKMNHTTIYQQDKDIFKRAYGYHKQDASWKFADQSLTSATMGDGSVYTSVDEYLKWIKYLWQLDPANKNVYPLAPHASIKKRLNYGYGWFIATDEDGSTAYFHSGESTGFHNIVYHNPSKKLLIALFTNSDDDRAGEAFELISEALELHLKEVPEGETLFDFLSKIYGD